MADATQTAGFQTMETSAVTRKFRTQDRIFYFMTLSSASFVVLLLLAILTVLVVDALPTFRPSVSRSSGAQGGALPWRFTERCPPWSARW